MKHRIFKNIIGIEINVSGKPLPPFGIIKVIEVSQEIQNLVREGYLIEVDQTKGTLK